MAAAQLHRGSEDWTVFRSWELQVYRNTKPDISVIALVTNLREEWNSIIDKVTYARALHKLQESSKDLEVDSIRLRRRLLTADNIKARNPAWKRYLDPLRAYERLIDSFDQYIEGLRGHTRCLQAVLREQSMLNMDGMPSSNERSWSYTTRMLYDTKKRLNDVSSQLTECKSWLRGDSPSRLSNRDTMAIEAKDDDDGETGTNSRSQNGSGTRERDTNVENHSDRARVSTTGGANVGAGTEDDENGSDDDDGKRNKRRQPDSKPGVDTVDEEDEQGEEGWRDDGNGASKTPSENERSSPSAERAGGQKSDDNGGPGPFDDLEEVVRQNTAELEETVHQSPDILDNFEEVLHQSLVEREEQARQHRKRPSPLRDYSYYQDLEAQEQPPVAPRAHTERTSQQAGASRRDAGGIEGGGQAALSKAKNRLQRSKGRKKTVVTLVRSEDPDDGGSSSEGNTTRPKDSNDRRPIYLQKPRGKRAGEDAAGQGDLREGNRKRRRQSMDDSSGSSVYDPSLDYLPDYAFKYYDEIITRSDRPPAWNSEKLYCFVERLCKVFDDEEEWKQVQEIESYFDEDGNELESQPACQILKRREFAKRWKSLIGDKVAPEDRASWKKQYARLEKVGAWHVMPSPGFGSGQDDLQELKFWVVEAENRKIAEAWEQYLSTYRQQYGPALADDEQNVYQAEIERVMEHGGSLDGPPPLPGHLVESKDLAQVMARRLGFAGNAPGVWNFVETLGIGGYGHAGLWIKYDSSGKILDRQVVKETYLDPNSWLRENFWMPPAGTRAIPREYWIGSTLAECEQAANILGPSKFTVHPTQRMYRLYMPFCPHGDLSCLLGAHGEFEASDYRDQDARRLRSPVPISVMWCIFEALASAACLMKDGHLPGDEDVEDWDTLYHRDLKPLNIFLDTPDENSWKNIPVPRLADFGLAMEHTPVNVKPPSEKSRGIGTPIYRAPECEECTCHRIFPHHEYTSAGDVFSIGQTMWSLMSRRHPEQYSIDDEMGPRDLPASARSFYPEKMRDLVNFCLQSHPDHRIKAEDLWCLIREEVTRFDGREDVPLRSRGLAEDETLHLKPDMYVSWAR